MGNDSKLDWQPIETAPKDGEFLATDGALLGIGSFYRTVEPETTRDWDAWRVASLPLPTIPNPQAGEVKEWYYASAFHAFDGEAETHDYDGPVGFTPTHWMPFPAPPKEGSCDV